jgi:hypothetical protein
MAFIASVKKNCPNAGLIVRRIKPPQIIRYHWVSSNTKKLEVWCKEMEKCDDEDIVLIDCDMMVLNNPEAIFKNDFDIAYTVRGTGGIPVNGGVIFVKKNERSLDFFRQFKIINDKMVLNPTFHQQYRDRYAGMNQAAFGYMLEQGKHQAKMITVPCNPYNICKNDWLKVNEKSFIVHVKSDLRRAVLHPLPLPPAYQRYRKLYDIWHKYYDMSKRIPVPDYAMEYSSMINLEDAKEQFPIESEIKPRRRKGNEAVHPAFTNKNAKRIYIP